MARFNQNASLVALVVALMGALASVEAQFDTLPAQQPATSATSAIERFKQMLQFDPIVNTGVSELGGRKTNVHVPGLFDMKLDTRPDNQGMRMSQSVLSGLVSIFMDRTRDSTTGRLTGPISVKVGGFTMYQNQEARDLGLAPSVPLPLV